MAGSTYDPVVKVRCFLPSYVTYVESPGDAQVAKQETDRLRSKAKVFFFQNHFRAVKIENGRHSITWSKAKSILFDELLDGECCVNDLLLATIRARLGQTPISNCRHSPSGCYCAHVICSGLGLSCRWPCCQKLCWIKESRQRPAVRTCKSKHKYAD